MAHAPPELPNPIPTRLITVNGEIALTCTKAAPVKTLSFAVTANTVAPVRSNMTESKMPGVLEPVFPT